MPDLPEPRRWTIFVCTKCGVQSRTNMDDAGYYYCGVPCEFPAPSCREVEVVEACPAFTGGVCDSCGDADAERCPSSPRPCGHHCNHSWSHDTCCWCGKEWREVVEAHHGDPSEELRDLLYRAHEFIASVMQWDGQPDDQEEVLSALADRLDAVSGREG